jgi:hypothetical protein
VFTQWSMYTKDTCPVRCACFELGPRDHVSKCW